MTTSATASSPRSSASSRKWARWIEANPKAAARLRPLLTPRTNRYTTHRPTPQQAAFLLLEGREALYGGAAGGGKSDALLMAALQFFDVPGYSAILFRRTFADLALPGALMDRAHEWLEGTGARWNERDKTWTSPEGATLTFGYLEHERDKFRYQGAEFQFVGFDELTQFSESQYRYLFSRLRRLKGARVPIRMRAASNPGGVGHEWVSGRFLEPEARARGRVFVPAKLEDNPHLDREAYEESLAELDPITRAQLRDGNWHARHTGNVFRRDWFVIRDYEALPEPVRRNLSSRIRYWDQAATEEKPGTSPDFTAGMLGVLQDDVLYLLDLRKFRAKPEDVEARTRQTAEEDGPRVMVVIEQEPGSSGKSTISHYQRDVLKHFLVDGDRVTGSKRERWKPLVAKASRGQVVLARGAWNREFLDTAESVTWEINEAIHDDEIDAAAGCLQRLAEGDAGWLARMVKGT